MMAPPNRCRSVYRHHQLAGLRAALSADMGRYLATAPEHAAGDGFKKRLSAFLRPELQCLLLHRVSHCLHVRGWRRLGKCVAAWNHLLHKVSITPSSCIGPGCRLPHPAGVSFHGRAGGGLTLFSLAVCWPAGPFVDGPVEAGPHVGEGVTVAGQGGVVGAVLVGDGAWIACKVVLDSDAPPRSVALSNACRVSLRSQAAPAVGGASPCR